jgi:hypothetical protein
VDNPKEDIMPSTKKPTTAAKPPVNPAAATSTPPADGKPAAPPAASDKPKPKTAAEMAPKRQARAVAFINTVEKSIGRLPMVSNLGVVLTALATYKTQIAALPVSAFRGNVPAVSSLTPGADAMLKKESAGRYTGVITPETRMKLISLHGKSWLCGLGTGSERMFIPSTHLRLAPALPAPTEAPPSTDATRKDYEGQ